MGQEYTAETSLQIQRLIEDSIKKFVDESPGNRLADFGGDPIFEEPLVGFADGNDPLFSQYKSIIGEFHMTPREMLQTHAEGLSVEQLANIGVISWILPIAEATRRSNREMDEGPTIRWYQTRWHGEAFNDALKKHVIELLQRLGYIAIAPGLTPSFKTLQLDNGPASTWSERHVAYAAGLGTFSLSDGLITPKGIAMRCGSVVTNLAFVASPRNYANHVANCPFIQDGSCGVCIERCPAGAIGASGHDKKRCKQFLEVDLRAWASTREGWDLSIGPYVACGLCQTRVPCESQIPPRQ